MPETGFYNKTEEYSYPECFLQKTTSTFDKKMVELKCLIKEKDDRIALNKGSTISTNKNKRAEEAKAKGPAVSHLKHHCLRRCENVNVFWIYLKNILLFGIVQSI